MYWEAIEGWFDFENIYTRMINQTKNNAIFVEIGAWKGKSAVYMAEKIKESNKNITFYVIDTFEGSEEDEHYEDVDIINRTLYETYLKNIEPIKQYINTIKEDSKEAHKRFKSESLDFLFIDGDHTYEGVKKDLENWFPKIKPGGIIGGHDYLVPRFGVKTAVQQFFLFTGIIQDGGSWLYKK